MTNDDSVIDPVRQIDAATTAKVSPLPPPEEVFFDWLVALPPGACIEVAARREIELIDRRAVQHPDVRRLRMLLVAMAGVVEWQRPANI